MEDVLTSEVFGLLRYVPVEAGLHPFLSRAVSLSGDQLWSYVPGELTLRDLQFWPPLSEPGCQRCEPDVIVTLEDKEGTRHLVGVEAKYWSGKSDRDPADEATLYDQLAIQWQNLEVVATKMGATPALVYLTTHMCIPRHELEASERDWTRVSSSGMPVRLYWLSWRELGSLFAGSEHLALRDIAGCCERLNLTWFQGFTPLPETERITWRFDNKSRRNGFDWANTVSSVSVTWRFQNE